MASTERLLYGFAYHRVGLTNTWRPSGSTLVRLGPDHPWEGPGIRLAAGTGRIVWIDVAVEVEADSGRDLSDLSDSCEAGAGEEFRRLFPQAVLGDS